MLCFCMKQKNEEDKIVDDCMKFITNKKDNSFMVQLPYIKRIDKEEFSSMYSMINKLMIYDPKKDDYICYEEINPWPELIINLTNRIQLSNSERE